MRNLLRTLGNPFCNSTTFVAVENFIVIKFFNPMKNQPYCSSCRLWFQATLLLVFICQVSLGVLVSEKTISEQLSSAELVADVLIKSIKASKNSELTLTTVASAEIIKIHKNRASQALNPRDEIEIEFAGGELDGVGVMYSGLPRPNVGLSYKAYLNRSGSQDSQRYWVTGFESGFKPLNPSTRKYSRNRTSGPNGEGDGAFLYWDPRYFPISYFISSPSFKNNQDYVTAIEESFKTWRSFDDVLVEFVALGCNRSTKNENDGQNTIIFLTESWPHNDAAIAITRNFYMPDEGPNAGMILDSDILLNGKLYKFTTTGQTGRHDIQNIVTHELGHFLGFGHDIGVPVGEQTAEEAGDPAATMYFSAELGQTNKRTLHANDLEALRAAYSGVGQKFENHNLHCEVSNNNVGCLSVHSTSKDTKNFIALALYLLLTLGLGRWIVAHQKP